MSVKVVFLHPTLEFGGAERFVFDLIAHSNPLAIDPVLVTFRFLAPFLEGALPKVIYLEDLGVTQGDIALIFGRLHMPRAFRVARRLAAMLRDQQAAVAVGVLHLGAFLLGMAKHFLPDRVRCLANLHGPATAYFRAEPVTRLRRLGERLCLAYLCRRADGIVVPSEGVREDLIYHFGVPARMIQTIHNGIHLEAVRELARAATDWPWADDGIPTILGTGRLCRQKNFDSLIRAFALLRSRVESRLLIVGEGSHRPQLEELVTELGLADACALIGFRKNPLPYMTRSTVFALSSYYEGFPIVLLEAMACGIPIVATAYSPSGPAEVIRQGQTGLLVPVGDPAAMAEAIEILIREPALRSRLAGAAAQTVESFTIARSTQGYESALLSQAAAQ